MKTLNIQISFDNVSKEQFKKKYSNLETIIKDFGYRKQEEDFLFGGVEQIYTSRIVGVGSDEVKAALKDNYPELKVDTDTATDLDINDDIENLEPTSIFIYN